ncbi:hypothetical protein [Amycolatopsis thailandensis]|uniref:hypothetical protein n=1 Tax=Amycolatopsis thailandensis TaxID=589330 RepID=UPI00142DB62F|nr:hypothetical protein [Amycolatopsis thailandensis]
MTRDKILPYTFATLAATAVYKGLSVLVHHPISWLLALVLGIATVFGGVLFFDSDW